MPKLTKNYLLNKAIEIASIAHVGQTRFGNGESYILHPLRVMMKMKSLDEKIVAVLHDVVEDTEWAITGLAAEGFLPVHLDAVNTLSKKEGQIYSDYINDVKKNELARAVKIRDIEDNLDISEIKRPLSDRFANCQKKYQLSRQFLMEG